MYKHKIDIQDKDSGIWYNHVTKINGATEMVVKTGQRIFGGEYTYLGWPKAILKDIRIQLRQEAEKLKNEGKNVRIMENPHQYSDSSDFIEAYEYIIWKNGEWL